MANSAALQAAFTDFPANYRRKADVSKNIFILIWYLPEAGAGAPHLPRE